MDDTTRVFDHYLHEFRRLQDRFERHAGDGQAVTGDLAQQLVDLSEEQGRRLLALVSAGRARDVADSLHAHLLHREVILQSPLLKHALERPRGYAVDMALMLMICQPPRHAPAGFPERLDAFYRDLPASQAVRDRVRMLASLLDDLPPRSRVLNLACGPALEVQSHFSRRPDATLVVDHVDHVDHASRPCAT